VAFAFPHHVDRDDERGGSQTQTLTEPEAPAEAPRRKRGRPLEMTPEQVLDHIRRLSAGGDGLFRVHHSHTDLYARARRQFGSWAAAVAAAGMDYADAIKAARRRAIETRRVRRKNKLRNR
jgi:hypothetical protein